MKKLIIILISVMLMFSGCTTTEQQSTSPYTVIDSVLGGRTVGDGCVYERIRHTDGSQAIGVIDISSNTKKLLNEETVLGNVGDSYGDIFYANGYLYRVLDIDHYQEIEQFTADGKFVKELIINNDTEFWIDRYRTPVITDGKKIYFDGKVYHDRWDGNEAILSFDPETKTMEAVYEITEGSFMIAGVYGDCFILNSYIPNPYPEVDSDYIPAVELLNMKTFEREVLFENIYDGEYIRSNWTQLDDERIFATYNIRELPVYNIRTREKSTLPVYNEGDGYHYAFLVAQPEDNHMMVWTSSEDYTKHSYYMYNLKNGKKTSSYEGVVPEKKYPTVCEYLDGYYLVSIGMEDITASSGKVVHENKYAWIKAEDLYNGEMNLEYITNTVEYK